MRPTVAIEPISQYCRLRGRQNIIPHWRDEDEFLGEVWKRLPESIRPGESCGRQEARELKEMLDSSRISLRTGLDGFDPATQQLVDDLIRSRRDNGQTVIPTHG